MTKSELIATIADNAKISKADAGIALEATLLAVKEGLLRSGKVVLPGLGTFDVTDLPARTGRNPATGEPVDIPAKRKVRFRAAKNLKELIKPA